MGSAVLLVTWFVVGQPPYSYQVDFTSIDACQEAARGLVHSETYLRGELGTPLTRKMMDGSAIVFEATRPPVLVTLCAKR